MATSTSPQPSSSSTPEQQIPKISEEPNLLQKFINSTKRGLDSAADSTANFVNAIGRPAELVQGVIIGNTVDLAGMPIDLMNATAVRPIEKLLGLPAQTKAPSDHLRNLIGLPDSAADTPANTAGSFLSPAGASKAMIVAAARVVKTADLVKAQELVNLGVNNASIFNLTGAYSDADKGLKSIISDSKAALKEIGFVKTGFGTLIPKTGATVGDVLSHEKLFELYPSFRSIPVSLETGASVRGSMGDLGMTIKGFLPEASEDAVKIMLHELQHGVNKKEGFAKGGSTAQFLPKDIVERTAKVREEVSTGMKSSDPATKLKAVEAKTSHNAMIQDAHLKYENLPAEQEARFTELTREFSVEKLGATLLNMLKTKRTPQTYDTQTVPKARR